MAKDKRITRAEPPILLSDTRPFTHQLEVGRAKTRIIKTITHHEQENPDG